MSYGNVLNSAWIAAKSVLGSPNTPAYVAALGHMLDSWNTNSANAEQAQRNRDFQERMSSTQVQRRYADMAAAGVNPYLAAAGGGASSPGGAQAQMQNVISPGLQAAFQIRMMNQQLAQMKANVQNTKVHTELSKTQIPSARNSAYWNSSWLGKPFSFLREIGGAVSPFVGPALHMFGPKVPFIPRGSSSILNPNSSRYFKY